MFETRQANVRAVASRTGPILGGKVFQYLGALLTAVLVPRLMGPGTYGSYAVYLSTLITLWMLAGLGTLSIYGRFVPGFLVENRPDQVRRLFSELFLLKAGVALILGLLFLVLGRFILPDWPAVWLWLGAATLLLRVTADNGYQLAFGLDRPGRWIVRESLRNLVQFGLVLLLFSRFSLIGAIVAVLITDLFFFLLCMTWSWPYLSWKNLSAGSLRPYLRYGIPFYAGAVLLMSFFYGGNILLATGGVEADQIAFFDLAFAIFIILYNTISQLVLSATPTLARWQTRGENEDVESGLNLLWKLSLLAAVAVILGFWLLADAVVPLMIGSAFSPVASIAKVLMLCLLPLSIGQMSFMVAAVFKKPAIRLWSSASIFLAYIGLSLFLIPQLGVWGVVVAALIATTIYALVTFWLAWPHLNLSGWRLEYQFLRTRFQIPL